MSVAAASAIGPATPPLCLPPPRSPTSAKPLLDGEPISPQGALPSASWTPARLHVLLLLRLLAVDPPGALRYPCGRRRRPGHLDRPSRRSLAAAPGSRSLAASPGRRSMATAPGSRPWQPPLAADSGRRTWQPPLGHLAVAARLLWPLWLGRPGRRCLATLAAAARPPWQRLPGHPGRRSPATLAARLGASCAAAGPPLAACPRRHMAAHHAHDGHAAASAGHAPLGRQAPRD